MYSFSDQQRFVIAVGDSADRVAEDGGVTVLSQLDRVVLVEASYRTAVALRLVPDVVVHIFEREADARRALDLFKH